MSLRRRLVVPVIALALGTPMAAAPFLPAALAADCGDGATSLVNGNFEDPGLDPDGWGFFLEADVPGWHTTDVGGVIELWGDGFFGVPAAEGTTFAELNANSAGTLYQDLVTTPGATMTWTLQHRAREGEDAMRVLIGDAATADVASDDGWDYVSDDLVDDTEAWGTHSDSYVVPEGQTCTRFAFRAVSAGSGDASVGNFIDDITFDITIPAPPSAPPSAAPSLAASVAASVVTATQPPTDTVGGDAPGTGTVAVVSLSLLVLATALAAAVATRTPRRGRPD
jgi:hypothetical protein